MNEKCSLGKRLRLSWVCTEVAPLISLGFGFFFLRFATSVKIRREVWDFVFELGRNWDLKEYMPSVLIYIHIMYNTKLHFSPFSSMYGLILTTVTLFFHFRMMHSFRALVEEGMGFPMMLLIPAFSWGGNSE